MAGVRRGERAAGQLQGSRVAGRLAGALQELRELVDDDAVVGDLGLALVIDEEAGHLFLGLAVAPAEHADEVGGGDAPVVTAQVGQDLALVGELVAGSLRRSEDEVEDRLDELLLGAAVAEGGTRRGRRDRATPGVPAITVTEAAVAAAVTPVGEQEPEQPAEVAAAAPAVAPPIVAAEHHAEDEQEERDDVDDEGDRDPRLEGPHADAGEHPAGGAHALGEGRLITPRQRWIERVQKLAVLGHLEARFVTLEQAIERIVDGVGRETGQCDRIGLGETSLPPAQRAYERLIGGLGRVSLRFD